MSENNYKTETRLYSGKGTTKFTEYQVAYIMKLHNEGIKWMKIGYMFNKEYGTDYDSRFFMRIIRNPHKYVIGYKKPIEEYKGYVCDNGLSDLINNIKTNCET